MSKKVQTQKLGEKESDRRVRERSLKGRSGVSLITESHRLLNRLRPSKRPSSLYPPQESVVESDTGVLVLEE